jgi:predicted amidohydrolase YtcJ
MRILFFVVLALAVNAFGQKDALVPDTIYLNGNIYTGVRADLPKPTLEIARVQAIAVKGDRILSIGTDAQIKGVKGKGTQVVDLAGRFVMPGFNDAHMHLAAGGLEKTRVNLIGVKSLDEMKARIAAAVKNLEPGEWIAGRGWDQTLWASQKLPSRYDLDEVTAGHPAFLSRVDGHAAVVNSAALKARGVTSQTPDPPGGSYSRDANGEPTGIIREAVWDQFYAGLPKASLAQRRRGIELALAEAKEWGLTSAQDSVTAEDDPTEWDDFLLYEDLEREGKLTVRVTRWLSFHEKVETLEKHRAHHPQDDPMLHTGMLGEAYLDGSLGSRSAALLAPYADDPKNTGILRTDPGTLTDMTVERTLAGFQIGFHAIGDRAAQIALDAIAQAELRYKFRNPNAHKANPDLRFRIEHDQVIDVSQVRRFAELGVIASVQPSHLLTDMHWAEARLGPARAKMSYPWRSFASQGVHLAFGTDFAVEPMNPFRGLYAAVTRKSEDGKQSYYPEQALTIDEAIAAYTSGSAYAEFAEKDKGTLAPGMLADFVVLDRDITKVPPEQILQTKVLQTYVGGKNVYSRP